MKSELVEKVIIIVNPLIEKASITNSMLDDDLQQMGMDSISFIRIVVSLEDEFNIEFPDDYLLIEKMNTIHKIIGMIEHLINGNNG